MRAPAQPPDPLAIVRLLRAPSTLQDVRDGITALDLVRRILTARNPAALRELEDGADVHAGGGEAALLVWLGRPLPAAPVDGDPLVELFAALGKVKAQLADQSPGRAPATANALVRIAKAIEDIQSDRPRPQTEDELQARLCGLDAEAKAKIEEKLQAHEARAARPRPGAPYGVCVTCEAVLVAPLDPPP